MSTAYVQAVGTIRALEARLLNDQGLKQLASAANFISAVNEVKNKIYGVPTERMQHLPETLSTIDQEEEYLLIITAKLVFHPQLANIIFWYSHLTEIKSKIKNTLILQEQVPEQLKTWPEFIKQAWAQAQKEYAANVDLKIVDFVVDTCYLRELHGILAQIHSPWLDKLCLLAVDFYNIKTWLRFKMNEMPPKNDTALFLNGGGIDRKIFGRSWEMPVDDFIQALKFKPYMPELTTAWQQVKQHGNWLALDLFFTNYIIKILQSAKLLYDGPEPILAYLIIRIAELNNIRVILSGKFYNLSKELITKRLSRSYV
ncbi:MAG: V-type ATPase subunit [Elusimicrobia bacterium]|nr:V-type ATPase subunit [Elusimicrobiota bacterium]